MPPHLDLSHSSHNMMVAPPRMNLRRAVSYTTQDRGPLSSTSSRFNFNHLIFSPPPSPSLPALVPRRKRAGSARQILATKPTRLLRRLFFLLIFLSNIYCIAFFLRDKPVVQSIWPYFREQEFEMVGQDELPKFPTPIVTTDSKGHLKWTVSIPRNQPFPLSVEEYAEMGGQCREVSSQARDLHHKKPVSEQAMLQYDAPDDYFIDVAEAEEEGMLPGPKAGEEFSSAAKMGNIIGADSHAVKGKEVCQSSMTFVLEGTDAGLGNTMMMLWTFYGMAKEQGRAFFIEDSRWAYGDYETIFRAPPPVDCRPPPRHQMVPCPFQARHLVVSPATASEVFPALLAKHRRVTGQGNSLRDYFELARKGYEALGGLSDEDRFYVDERIRRMNKRADKEAPRRPIIGYHVRRGDKHPLDFQYQTSYIPSEVYQETSDDLLMKHFKKAVDSEGNHHPLMLLASDDPKVKREAFFSGAKLAQERVRLSSKDPDNVINKESNSNSPDMRDFEAEPFGWEGGFYPPVFWNLGRKTQDYAGAAATESNTPSTEPPSSLTLILRNYVGRAYMMDLAVLAGASDHVVCAVSAMGCRMLAVMMGWEKAMDQEGWVNVDGDYGWAGIQW